MKQVRPDTLGRPALEAIVQRLARPVDRGGVLPPATGDQDMHDTADDAAVIDPGLASGVARKVRLKPCKLLHRQPELTVAHRKAPFQGVESQRLPDGKALYGSGP